MSLAVLGTDTGVGKTITCALLLARYGRPGGQGAGGQGAGGLSYWKPVATGGERDRDTQYLRGRLEDRAEILDEVYRFTPPVSPHLAARMAGVRVEGDRILAVWKELSARTGREYVVEGAGGALVPLNDEGDLLVDLIARLEIPAVIVARTTIGTINHTLLTLEALRRRGIPVAGVVLDGIPNPENREAIERFGTVEVVAEVPPLIGGGNPSRAALLNAAEHFDRGGVLGSYLGRK